MKNQMTWEEFHKASKKLAEDIKTSKNTFNRLVAITRGGLFLAGILAYELKIIDIDTINVISYQNKKRKAKIKYKQNSQFSLGDKVLVVDDICDSGNTLREVYKRNSEIDIQNAVFYKKKDSTFTPDFFVEEVNLDIWVNFPWDK